MTKPELFLHIYSCLSVDQGVSILECKSDSNNFLIVTAQLTAGIKINCNESYFLLECRLEICDVIKQNEFEVEK